MDYHSSHVNAWPLLSKTGEVEMLIRVHDRKVAVPDGQGTYSSTENVEWRT